MHRVIIGFATGVGLSYTAFSFIHLNLNAADWGIDGRAEATVLAAFFGFIGAAIGLVVDALKDDGRVER